MGREVITTLTFDGHSALGKLLLEADEIILRGALATRIPRHLITGFGVDGQDLVISTPGGEMRAHMGAKQAALWATALAKPVPDLAQKLGLRGAAQTWVIGALTDPALIAATQSAAGLNDNPECDVTSSKRATPVQILVEVTTASCLQRLTPVLQTHPLAAVWCVTVKGASALIPTDKLRQIMRDNGYIDTKSCAVSDKMTATRYTKRKSPGAVYS